MTAGNGEPASGQGQDGQGQNGAAGSQSFLRRFVALAAPCMDGGEIPAAVGARERVRL